MNWFKSLFFQKKEDINKEVEVKLTEEKIELSEEKEKSKKEIKKYILPPINIIQSNESSLFLESLKNEGLDKINLFLKKYDTNEFEKINICQMPNLLIGGTIMTGKTSLINSIICKMLMTNTPDELKMIILDSKKIDLSVYNGIPHLLIPVITDSKKANIALKRVFSELERRIDLIEENKTKNIENYNNYLDKLNSKLSYEEKIKKIPYLLLIIDEFTFFSLNDEENIELIEKISQLGYIAGIHIILVANHPSAKVISKLAQSNFSTRIAFKTVSKQDSRLIIDENGAEELTEKGTFLYKSLNVVKPIKLIVPYIGDDDIKRIVDYVCCQQKMQGGRMFEIDSVGQYSDVSTSENKLSDYVEPLYDEIVQFVIEHGKASASILQRRFRLGYNRAARCIDLLEERGIVGPSNGSKPREVLKKQ